MVSSLLGFSFFWTLVCFRISLQRPCYLWEPWVHQEFITLLFLVAWGIWQEQLIIVVDIYWGLSVYIALFHFFLNDRVLCSSHWPQTHYVAKDDFEFPTCLHPRVLRIIGVHYSACLHPLLSACLCSKCSVLFRQRKIETQKDINLLCVSYSNQQSW